MTDDRCGSEDTTTGEPCQFKPGPSCPWHDTDNPPDNGRKTVLNEDLAESITSTIAEGKSITSAVRMAGIPKSTYYNWLDRGEGEEDTVYADLLERHVRARGLGEDYIYSTVWDIAAREGDLPTLMSILKQRYPESWGEVNRGEQSGGVVIHTAEPEEFEIDEDTLEAKPQS